MTKKKNFKEVSEKEVERYTAPYIMPTSVPVHIRIGGSSWDEFFDKVRLEFRQALPRSKKEWNLKFHLELIDDMIEQFRILLANGTFNRSAASAIAKIFELMTWYGIPDQDRLGDFLLDGDRAREKLHDTWNEKRFKNIKAASAKVKKFRKPLDTKKLDAAIKKHRHQNGKPNWTRIGKELGVDPDTVQDQAEHFGLYKRE